MFSALRRWRRRRQADRMTVSTAQWEQVEQSLPFLAWRPAEDRPRLRRLALEFLAEKQVHGARGLEVSDTMLLSIALQACLPVLQIGLDAYADWVGIIVYPGDFVIPRSEVDENGVIHEYDDEVLGEAWEGGPVLLSWFDGDDAPAGINVVIHEFAHKLDMRNGEADGIPPLPAELPRREWESTLMAAYEDFCAKVDTLDAAPEPLADEIADALPLDPYAAENPGEFFAVASETFFETPDRLATHQPALYTLLKKYFRQDPLRQPA